jgi:hypothetical protein
MRFHEGEQRGRRVPERVRPTDDELHAWENQCDPRLPRCLAEADDKLQHLRECTRCRDRGGWY